MPRDFVPCMYHEWERCDEGTHQWTKRYEVTEVFAAADILTQQPYWTITGESHACDVRETQSQYERVMRVPGGQAMLESATRKLLFRAFYTAMAALE